MKNILNFEQKELLLDEAKKQIEQVDTLEDFLNLLYKKLKEDEVHLSQEEYRRRVDFITSIEFKIDCAEQDAETLLGAVERHLTPITPNQVNNSVNNITKPLEETNNDNQYNGYLEQYFLGKGEDFLETSETIICETKNIIGKIVSSARNFTAFYKPETKAAIENLFLLEAEIEKLKILQNKTKSKTKRKNLKKQELDKIEEFKELSREIESYFYVDYYFPTTLLTKENDLVLDNPIDESIQSTSEYYFSSIMTIIDGGNVVYESSSGVRFQSHMNLSDGQKELLKQIDSLDAGLLSPDFDNNAKQVFQDKKNKYVFQFLKSREEFSELMNTREALELESELEALSPSPVIEMSPEELEDQFISYFSSGIGIESPGEDIKNSFDIDIFGNSMTTSLNYSGLHELFPEIFDAIFQLQSKNHEMQIEIEKLKEKKSPVPPSRIRDREIAILKNNQSIIYYLGELYKDLQDFRIDSEGESDDEEENDSVDQLKFDYYFGDGDSFYESGKSIIGNGDKKIYQNYTNLSPEQKELIIQIHALGVDIDRFSFVLERYENEGNAEKAMKIIQGIETLYKKQDDLIKIFFASQKKN